MPLYIKQESWMPSESGLIYTEPELSKRVLEPLQSLGLDKESIEFQILGSLTFYKLDLLFNQEPN